MNLSHIHPFIVHFSVSLVVIGALFDFYTIIVKRKPWIKGIGFPIMIFAALAILLSWFSGEYLSRKYDGVGEEVRELHENMAKFTYAFYGAAFIIRVFAIYRKENHSLLKYIFMLFLALAVISILYSGFLGGTLVYDLQNDLRPGQ